ncbi:DUF4139 domain-containing protein [Deinococcus soli (ex Cha et al. 2016)]|uniref:Uncharacterized protein n=2 Tax=Deinococcus soli (ex Cha et al. 2016) TaxID=1309411 RepID=A0ACC6KD04_9DEIO|nr:DUF4139 domain-containing protein [Deinococcus soli (ex Cha et al. 2016)]MDR6217627.1 hypothetical protein [Deinococcus soli (ex Cha et al. 2016)]MDR6326936.1 hypothetical protein [Deinococcus soli (ex Cha et al. 2016)]MDR6750338.1 hypothetical protein [Deinococcus soli (ex Cha et al. 2016)]
MKNSLSVAAAVATTLALGTASAADLRIYPSFSEVREPVTADTNTLRLNLPLDTWQNILSGSLDLEGLSFTQAIQKQEANWLSSLEGQTIYLRRDGKTEPVTLIRARDLLVKDTQGRYFTARYEDLQFDAAPPANPQAPTQSVTYTLAQPGKGTLSYLTRAVTWTPRYTLKAGSGGAQLSALADIRNTTEQAYDVQNTELYAGDVTVQGQQEAAYMMRGAAMDVAMPAAAPAPKIESQGELRGLYRYALTTPFQLPANSVTTLPFITPKLSTFERYAGLQTYFDTGTRDGNLNRSYRLKADQRLPAGPITVREDGRIVGQTSIPDTRQGGTVDFSLGEDPDLNYTRTVQQTAQTKNAQGNVTKTTYKVTYAFESSKDRAIRAEITERIGGRVIIIDTMAPVKNQGTATLKVDVPAKGKVSKSFTVVIDNS